jgi:hypothetical protein
MTVLLALIVWVMTTYAASIWTVVILLTFAHLCRIEVNDRTMIRVTVSAFLIGSIIGLIVLNQCTECTTWPN